jgi:hypothetical protein
MEKRTIFLELSSEIIDKIDQRNTLGDRSLFVSSLLEKQLKQSSNGLDASTEITTRMEKGNTPIGLDSELGLLNNHGDPLRKFNINSIEGFEELATVISELSEDPIVRMRARGWL